jgi:1-acyl-sn-glycerol-3-phosphate acyltransferase
MTRQLSWAWRVVGTGASFVVFGLGGLALAGLVFPILRWLPGETRDREFRCQLAVHHCFRFFVRFMAMLGVNEVELRGVDSLRQPGQLVVANHPTLLDVVFLIALMPQADCVVKAEAWSNPFMRGAVRGAGYLPNDLGDRLVDVCAERLRAGRSLVLFPGGTRDPKGEIGSFRRGAAHIALRSGRPLRPVFIGCEPPSLMRGQKWYEVPDRRPQYTVECGEVIDPELLRLEGLKRGSAARVITAALRDFFTKRSQTLDS